MPWGLALLVCLSPRTCRLRLRWIKKGLLINVHHFCQVYYARVSAIARLETITMLKRQLQLSSFDKKFLLKQIQENSRGRFSKEGFAGDSHEVSRHDWSNDLPCSIIEVSLNITTRSRPISFVRYQIPTAVQGPWPPVVEVTTNRKPKLNNVQEQRREIAPHHQ